MRYAHKRYVEKNEFKASENPLHLLNRYDSKSGIFCSNGDFIEKIITKCSENIKV